MFMIKTVMLLALVVFVVFFALKLTGNFNYEWLWVFSPLLFGQAIIWLFSMKI